MAKLVDGDPDWGPSNSIGLIEDGEIIAGVVFAGYVVNARCSMHCAGIGKRWLNREFLVSCFDYAFNQLNCNVILNTVDSTNLDSIRFTTHIGFEPIVTVKGGCGASDLIIFKMDRDKCKWINLKAHI